MLPILIGFLRFCIISDLDYQAHPSEWGIHWNFFTTIAAITLCQNIIVKSKYTILIGLLILFSYQIAITHYGLEEFIFFAPRTDFISANREGILSVLGYFSLQIIGIGIGRLLYSEMLDPQHFKHLKEGKRPMIEINSMA